MTYLDRQKRRELANRLRREADRAAVLIGVESTMREHEDAVLMLTGRRLSLRYHHGHVLGATTKQVTVKQLQELTQKLWAAQHERELDNRESEEID
jgi:precorrin-2 methylase